MTTTKLKLLLALPIIALALGFLALPHSAKAATYTVTNTDDAGAGSLRQAITDTNSSVGADTIAFNIAGAGVHTIAPLTNLPAVTDQVTIDGTTQPGAGCDPRVLLIEISGENLDHNNPNSGIQLSDGSSGSIVKGLVINRFTYDGEDEAFTAGILIDGDSDADTIVCNFIGTNPAGNAALPNYTGVAVLSTGLNDILIGGSTLAERNVISGNAFAAIGGFDVTAHVVIKGNYLGPTADGTAALGNGFAGGVYFGNTSNVVVGGTEPGAGNVFVAGDTLSYYGIILVKSNNSIIQGNKIGTNEAGTDVLGGDIAYGIYMAESTNPTIGGSVPNAGNVSSAVYNVILAGVLDGRIQGNKLGTNSNGTACLNRNTQTAGVIFTDGSNNITVGGNNADARNIISCGKTSQVYGEGYGIAFTANGMNDNNTIQGNYIGTNANGQVQASFGNEGSGIVVGGGSNNHIGGTQIGEGNIIAGNGAAGVRVVGNVIDPDNPDLGQALNNSIIRNSIFGNGGLGIDLIIGDTPGVTPNDAGDPDYGPNHFMNFPVISSVTSSNGQATITYDLDINPAEPGATGYRVEFFANDSADPSGHGQGQTYIGSDTVSGDVTGKQVTITLPSGVDGSKYITATTTMTDDSTDGFGHTSEFAADVQATLLPPTPTPGPTPSPTGNSTDSSSLANTGQPQNNSQRLFIALALIAAGVLGLGGQQLYSKKKRKSRV